MPYTLTLTDHEAYLVERALRRQTKQMSDVEHVAVGRIADRLLRDIIHADVEHGARWPVLEAIDHTTRCTGTVTRQSDEYACSCGARWDVGDDHP